MGNIKFQTRWGLIYKIEVICHPNKPGYTGNRKITDHKCTSNCAQTCDKNAYCAVMPNSENLYCQCNEGFVGDGLSCIGQSAV